MTDYRHTRIKQIVDCLRSCWNDIYEMCRDWSTTSGKLTEAERLKANQFYLESELNRNARRLHDLTSSPELLSEIQQGQYSVEMMKTNLAEIERIEVWIDSWFESGQSSEDIPVNEFLLHDINHRIRYATESVKYILAPYLRTNKEEVTEYKALDNNSKLEKSPLTSSLFIVPEARVPLYNTIASFVDESERSSLKTLIIQGICPSAPITLHCQQNRLGGIFYALIKNNQILAGAPNGSRWLCKNFRRIDNGVIKSLSQSTLESHLKGKNLPKA